LNTGIIHFNAFGGSIMKRNTMLILVVLSILALVLFSGCATKKFVREEVQSSETRVNQKMDQEVSKLNGQINELSSLNKQLSSRIEQVSDKAATADAKAEEAKRIGTDAKGLATQANTGVTELRARFDARNNYAVIDTKNVHFDFNKSTLTAEAKATLDEAARLFAGNKNMVMTLEGYTDGIGSEEYNYGLSEKRVQSVVRYMVGEKSVDLNRIFVVGLGKTNPVADNKTAEGRKQNRRVTIKLLEAR